jgi:hypothetical protein
MTFGLSNALTFNLVVTLAGSTCFWSCSSDQTTSHSTEDYYLNHMAFAGKGIVYRYTSVNDPSLPDEFWHYRFDGAYRGNFLRATMYTASGDVVQRSVERLTRQKAELLSLDLLYRDEVGSNEIVTAISENDTFVFGPIDSLTLTGYQIEYWDTTEDSVWISLTKHRLLEGPAEFVFEGKFFPAIKVQTTEKLETETEGFTETVWHGVEIFAQGLGLVYYRKTISEQFILEYRLAEILEYPTFQTQYLIQSTHQNNAQ